MASYHSKFIYNGKDSAKNYGLIITSFEPDNGFTDSFLAMENISDDYYNGTKRFDYGAKYSKQAEIQITLIKRDGTDMTVNEFRAYSRWLNGEQVNSWLDMYAGEEFVYSFLGKFTNLEQYKLDGRTVGIRLTFSSVSPWAYSAPKEFDRTIKQSLSVDNGVGGVYRGANGFCLRGLRISVCDIDGHLCVGYSFVFAAALQVRHAVAVVFYV